MFFALCPPPTGFQFGALPEHLRDPVAAPSRGHSAPQKARNSGRGVRLVSTNPYPQTPSLLAFKSWVIGGLRPTVKIRLDCFLSYSATRWKEPAWEPGAPAPPLSAGGGPVVTRALLWGGWGGRSAFLARLL